MAPVVHNRAAFRRQVLVRRRVVQRVRARIGPAPVRDASNPESWIECSRGGGPRADGARPAVSLRVEPELVLALREALVFAPGIKAAFVHGAAARSAPSPALPRKRGREAHAAAAQGHERPRSPINLMVIGEATLADCFCGLRKAEEALGRRIVATFMTVREWRRELKRGSAFVTRVKAQPRIFIFAGADDWWR